MADYGWYGEARYDYEPPEQDDRPDLLYVGQCLELVEDTETQDDDITIPAGSIGNIVTIENESVWVYFKDAYETTVGFDLDDMHDLFRSCL